MFRRSIRDRAAAACILASTIVSHADFVGKEAGKAVVFVGIGAFCTCGVTHSRKSFEHHKTQVQLVVAVLFGHYDLLQISRHHVSVNSSTSRSHYRST